MTELRKQVSVLMGTYNGARHIKEQLRSIAAQDYPHWTLTASDDGSSDGTLGILAGFQKEWGEGRLKVVKGPGMGFCRNFLGLAMRDRTGSDYFAWADQDDVWLPSKLGRALRLIAPYGEELPVLYCARTRITDASGLDQGLSPLRQTPPPGFSNAVIQSLAGANTMVFNRKARDLIAKGYHFEPVSHDWWAYQIVSGAGGMVVYDPNATVRYRQHGLNIIGSNNGLMAFLGRARRAWRNGLRAMNDRNFLALRALEGFLTAPNRETLEGVLSLRSKRNPLDIRRLIKRYNIFRRSPIQQAALYLGFMAQRV
ncbi:MAG: glycosyltransferase family 2 protein [Deltaproteobacteria bacterium]|jgi:glycosyltransferase involved in cell wall biosynthesis|nr:glycosyltransferase family 2 protein [Deltaproteobacteria bacterium]